MAIKNVLLAVPFFALVGLRLAQGQRLREFCQEQAARGQFVCGTCFPSSIDIPLFGLTGLAILFGRYRTAVVLGILGWLVWVSDI